MKQQVFQAMTDCKRMLEKAEERIPTPANISRSLRFNDLYFEGRKFGDWFRIREIMYSTY